MKEKRNKKINKQKFVIELVNTLIIFATVFTVLLTCYVSVSWFVYEQIKIDFNYLVNIALLAIILATIIEFFVRINKISLPVQVSVIYTLIACSCLILVLSINKNVVKYAMFWYVTFLSSFIGLVGVVVLLIIFKHREEKKLNESLNRHREKRINEK